MLRLFSRLLVLRVGCYCVMCVPSKVVSVDHIMYLLSVGHVGMITCITYLIRTKLSKKFLGGKGMGLI